MANGDNSEPTGRESAAAPTSPDSAPAPSTRPRSRWKVHLLTFAVTVVVVWGVGASAYIYFIPGFTYSRVENAIVSGRGSGVPAIPINTLYTQPNLATPSQSNSLESTENRDTLYTLGWLDLTTGPEVLHVPDMTGRYYAVQFTDPSGTVFAYVGRRATGTQAGDYLISGPGWHGTVPAGVTQQIVAPNNTVLVIGRTLVQNDGDLATAYGLAKQIQVTPLSLWHPSQ
ncbi:MAG TPA: DUF1254 domain-containing protein [Ktedonobacterales bacterium]|nr:DUF1254 domain-containing protein [Ktedonobacterales bacterium]